MAVFKTTAGKDPIKESTTTYGAGDMIFSQGDLGTDSVDMQGDIAALQAKAPKTVNNVLAVLSVLLKKAVEWEVIERMPCTVKLLRVQHGMFGAAEFAAMMESIILRCVFSASCAPLESSLKGMPASWAATTTAASV